MGDANGAAKHNKNNVAAHEEETIYSESKVDAPKHLSCDEVETR